MPVEPVAPLVPVVPLEPVAPLKPEAPLVPEEEARAVQAALVSPAEWPPQSAAALPYSMEILDNADLQLAPPHDRNLPYSDLRIVNDGYSTSTCMRGNSSQHQ